MKWNAMQQPVKFGFYALSTEPEAIRAGIYQREPTPFDFDGWPIAVKRGRETMRRGRGYRGPRPVCEHLVTIVLTTDRDFVAFTHTYPVEWADTDKMFRLTPAHAPHVRAAQRLPDFAAVRRWLHSEADTTRWPGLRRVIEDAITEATRHDPN